jgi:hypothetical protein
MNIGGWKDMTPKDRKLIFTQRTPCGLFTVRYSHSLTWEDKHINYFDAVLERSLLGKLCTVRIEAYVADHIDIKGTGYADETIMHEGESIAGFHSFSYVLDVLGWKRSLKNDTYYPGDKIVTGDNVRLCKLAMLRILQKDLGKEESAEKLGRYWGIMVYP